MTFTAKTRSSSGSIEEFVLEAADRTAAFAELKRRGVAVVSLTQGGNPAASKPSAGARRSPVGPVRGILAGLLVVVLALAAWYFLFNREPPAPPADVAPKPAAKTLANLNMDPRSRAVTNAVAVKPAEPLRLPRPPKQCGTNTLGYITNCHGYVIGKVGPAPVYTNRMDLLTQRPSHRIFKNAVHRKIAFLYEVEPGAFLFGDSERFVSKDFAQRFEKALSVPVTISPDDDEETRALKQGVIDTMADLKAVRDSGGDVREAMVNAREELREIGLYRQKLEKQFLEVAKDRTMSAQDLGDFLAAANQMLSERGAKPLSLPRTALRQMMMAHEKSSAQSAPKKLP